MEGEEGRAKPSRRGEAEERGVVGKEVGTGGGGGGVVVRQRGKCEGRGSDEGRRIRIGSPG